VEYRGLRKVGSDWDRVGVERWRRWRWRRRRKRVGKGFPLQNPPIVQHHNLPAPALKSYLGPSMSVQMCNAFNHLGTGIKLARIEDEVACDTYQGICQRTREMGSKKVKSMWCRNSRIREIEKATRTRDDKVWPWLCCLSSLRGREKWIRQVTYEVTMTQA